MLLAFAVTFYFVINYMTILVSCRSLPVSAPTEQAVLLLAVTSLKQKSLQHDYIRYR